MCMLPHLTETLHKKKRDAIQLSSSINDIKKKIDEVRCTLIITPPPSNSHNII